MLAEHITEEDAVGIVALAPGDPARLAAYGHAEDCDACCLVLTGAEQLLGMLDALPVPPPPSREVLERTSAAVLAELEKERQQPVAVAATPARVPAAIMAGRSDGLLAPAAAIFGWSLMIGLARWHNADTAQWLVAVSALVVAAVGTVIAASRGTATILIALLGSAALVAFSAGAGNLDPMLGVKCVATELASATFPAVATLWLALRRGRLLSDPVNLSAAAATGAVVGQAALLLTCPQHSWSHQLLFHLGGVVLALAAGLSVGRMPRFAHAFGAPTDPA